MYIEKMCEFYSRLGRTKHTVIRHSNVYGPYDKYDLSVVTSLVQQLQKS